MAVKTDSIKLDIFFPFVADDISLVFFDKTINISVFVDVYIQNEDTRGARTTGN